jgi:hypothetical protein
VLYNNRIGADCGVGNSTDGNNIILDTNDWACGAGNAGCAPAGAQAYLGGFLVAFNVSYNSGGGGVHMLNTSYATFANNSCYNGYLDTNNPGRGSRACTDDYFGGHNNFINNIAVTPCPTGNSLYAFSSTLTLNGNSAAGSLGAAITNTTSTSVTLASAANFPLGTNGYPSKASLALPGGNFITIDSEAMLVTAGWGTTTLTVQRGYLSTTAATHSNGATVQWQPDYAANNVTKNLSGTSCSDVNLAGGAFYSSVNNKQATNPSWVDVGNTSIGTISTRPVGVNFALQGVSPAIGYGQTPSWLPYEAVDAGACYHTLSTCP